MTTTPNDLLRLAQEAQWAALVASPGHLNRSQRVCTPARIVALCEHIHTLQAERDTLAAGLEYQCALAIGVSEVQAERDAEMQASARLDALRWANGRLLSTDGGFHESHVASGEIEREITRLERLLAPRSPQAAGPEA